VLVERGELGRGGMGGAEGRAGREWVEEAATDEGGGRVVE